MVALIKHHFLFRLHNTMYQCEDLLCQDFDILYAFPNPLISQDYHRYLSSPKHNCLSKILQGKNFVFSLQTYHSANNSENPNSY